MHEPIDNPADGDSQLQRTSENLITRRTRQIKRVDSFQSGSLANDAAQLSEWIERFRKSHRHIQSDKLPSKHYGYAILTVILAWFGTILVLALAFETLVETFGSRHLVLTWKEQAATLNLLVAIGVGVVVWRFWIFRSRQAVRKARKQALEMQIELFVHLFPNTVAAWGGRDVLLDQESVEAIADALAELVKNSLLEQAQQIARESIPTNTAQSQSEQIVTLSPEQTPITSEALAAERHIELVQQLHDTHVEAAATTSWWARPRNWLVILSIFGIMYPVVAIGEEGMREKWKKDFGKAKPETTLFMWLFWSPLLSFAAIRRLELQNARRRREHFTLLLHGQARTLNTLFPDAVAAWGGEANLLTPDTTRWLLHELTARANPNTARKLLRQYATLRSAANAAVPGFSTQLFAGLLGVVVFALLALIPLALGLSVYLTSSSDIELPAKIALLLIALAGLFGAGWGGFRVGRKYYRWRRHRRLEEPERKLRDWAELFLRFFPKETTSLGGIIGLLSPDNAENIKSHLDRLFPPCLEPLVPAPPAEPGPLLPSPSRPLGAD